MNENKRNDEEQAHLKLDFFSIYLELLRVPVCKYKMKIGKLLNLISL